MAREQANINTGLWADRDWRSLLMSEKYLYTLLLTHPTINYTGVVDWRPARIAALSPDTTTESIEVAARGLQEARFVFVDEDSEEVLIRSYLRHDGILKQPKLSVSMANAYAGTSSTKIQDIVAHEMHRLRSEYPDWAAWRSPKVDAVLKNPGQDMSVFVSGHAQPLPKEKAPTCPTFTLKPAQALPLPTSTSTSTSTSSPDGTPKAPETHEQENEEEEPRKPETKLPKSWVPTKAHWDYAKGKNIDIEDSVIAFKLHAETYDRRARSWNSAFSTWLRKSKPTAQTGSSPWDRKGIHD